MSVMAFAGPSAYQWAPLYGELFVGKQGLGSCHRTGITAVKATIVGACGVVVANAPFCIRIVCYTQICLTYVPDPLENAMSRGPPDPDVGLSVTPSLVVSCLEEQD